MYITRAIEQQLHTLLHQSPAKVIILLGARQVGKTTLVEPIVQSRGGLLLNCDLDADVTLLRNASALTPADALAFLGNPPLIAIDEAQNMPEIGRIVKGWYDAKVPARIILLGSSSLDLLDNTAEPLTGRNTKLFLSPLLFHECITHQPWYSPLLPTETLVANAQPQLQSTLLERMAYGSYPEAVTSSDSERYLYNLTADYLLRDVLHGGLIKTPSLIRKLLALLAHQIGSEVSVSELASTLGTTRPTVDNYLDLLERSYVIFRIHAYSTNQRKELSKAQKIYFWDTGIRNALLKEFSLSPQRSDIGALFENWVIAEVAKHNALAGNRNNLYFWRKTEGGEVDLVVKGTNTFKAYEIKWSRATNTRGTKSFSNLYGIPVDIVTKDTVAKLMLDM